MDAPYVPLVSDEYAEQIRRWRDRGFAPRSPTGSAGSSSTTSGARSGSRRRCSRSPGCRSSGDLDYLRRLIAGAGFAAQVVARARLPRDGWTVDYFTFRLTTGAGP